MNKILLNFLCDCEGWKTAVKNFHWNSQNLSQHNEMDLLLDEISSFQDILSEVEQSITGNLPFNKLKPNSYNMTTLQKFMEDIISSTIKLCNDLKNMGDKYIGIHSECESFLTKLQQRSYRINFSLKESFKKNYAKKLNESFETEDGILNDALEALDMFDGQIDFYEWSAAYQDEDESYLISVWNKACDEAGYSQLKENGMMESKNKKSINLTESELMNVMNEAIHNVMTKFINEIGDTPRGQFALGAVRGRSAARPRYQNNKFNSVPAKAKQDRINNMAGDEAWNERSKVGGFNDPRREQMNQQYGQGYDYGYKKGMTEGVDENCQSEVEVKGGMYNDKELDYTHFAVNKMTNLIVDGWGYAGYDSEELKQFKNDYFNVDLKENGFNPKMYKILSFKGCQKQGINPNNKQIWSNTGVYPLPQEVQMNKQGQNPYEAAQQEHPDWFVEN